MPAVAVRWADLVPALISSDSSSPRLHRTLPANHSDEGVDTGVATSERIAFPIASPACRYDPPLPYQ